MEFNPLVSIVIPVYNGSDYMKEAIDSALNQSYKNIEVIVINDGSKDEGKTRDIALSYGNRIRYFEKQNGGVSSALNCGIENMKGYYFSWLSHDDAYAPDKVKKQVELLSKVSNKKCIAMCRLQFMNSKSEYIGKPKVHKDRILYEEVSWQQALSWHIKCGSFGGCNLLIPKTAFDECGLFDESLRYVQDFLMWMKFFMNGYSLICSDEYGVWNRVHGNQLTLTGQELFHSESIKIGEMVIPELVRKSSSKYNFVYMYSIYNARYKNSEVVKTAIKTNKLSVIQVIEVYMTLLYGGIRPYIKKVYYKLFRK